MSRIANALKRIASLARAVAEAHIENNGDMASAAIAFYATLSIAPLLLTAVAVAGYIYGDAVARDAIITRVAETVSQDVAAQLQTALEHARASGSWLVGGASAVVSLYGASRLFSVVQSALNQIWGVRSAEEETFRLRVHARRLVIKRLYSFAMVAATGVAVTLLLILRTSLSALMEWLNIADAGWTIAIVEPLLTLPILGCMFAGIFKILPDARLSWRDVTIGAGVTTALIAAGMYALSEYLRYVTPGSSFGAAGTLVAMLVWAYYSAHIFLIGAQITLVQALRFGSGVTPEPHAIIALHAATSSAGAETALSVGLRRR
jgi:membrane protein